jgi:hypothetical protein
MFARVVSQKDVEEFCNEFRSGVSVSESGQEYIAKVPYINNSQKVFRANSWSDLLIVLRNLSDLTQEQEENWLVAEGLL